MLACRAGWEFYVHLNLARSCETPSDPTRCPLPPWHPCAAAAGLAGLVQLWCWCRCHWAGAGLALASLPCLDACGSAARCCWFAWLRAAACGICLFFFFALALPSVSFRLQCLPSLRVACLALRNLAALRASLLILSCLAWFHVAFVSFQCFTV